MTETAHAGIASLHTEGT